MTGQQTVKRKKKDSVTLTKKLSKFLKISLPVIAGGSGGYLYYYFIGCTSGTCPITGNPYISTAYGSLIGALFISWKQRSKND